MNLTEENIQQVIDNVKEATENLSKKKALALHVYLHAVVHKQDDTAIAAGLMAAKYMDIVKGALYAPVDCVMGVLISVHGFEEVADWDEEQFRHALKNMDIDTAFEVAKTYIAKDLVEMDGLQKEQVIDKLMTAPPENEIKH